MSWELTSQAQKPLASRKARSVETVAWMVSWPNPLRRASKATKSRSSSTVASAMVAGAAVPASAGTGAGVALGTAGTPVAARRRADHPAPLAGQSASGNAVKNGGGGVHFLNARLATAGPAG